ncbi:glycosyltransferase [Candidatus Symbiobacter mobilis]|uniref:Sulfoquinovosyltransferase n=1 Tax=Candidatus Symbiobacter mobilis CR TaxID=946483 RepID=U5NDZ5_9BURK|nr:glycosyltransferase [Candidatus Symbiobacter mobilis]AGX88344.1 sulfoquinovosyltransferase [Candidatus Symbiobacter mobilis CR]
MTNASVVINTFNRADYLPNAIYSIASQSYPNVELIVVNGPSTDATETELDRMEAQGIHFQRFSCPSRNLSESRNIGIANASGDVVLFIDDDAVAHRDWVTRIMRHYADPDVGAVGGFTFDHTGINYQCRYTVCDKFGNVRYFDTINPEQLLICTNDFYFPSLLGTNCSFSMSELRRIGGFDEVFAYMLDETDVCLRIVEGGKRVVTVPNAYVFHQYAPSYTRSPDRIPTSLLAPARSKAYFCLKHSVKGMDTSLQVFAEVDRYKKDIEFSNRWYLDHKKITPSHYAKISKELSEGVSEGLKLGLDMAVKTAVSQHLQLKTEISSKFHPILSKTDDNVLKRALKIYFVSQGYPPEDTSGIARWTFECARSLTELGHEVHIVTRTTGSANHVDFVRGVWIHAILDMCDDEITSLAPTPLPASIVRRAGAVLREIRRSEPIWGVDIVSAPIWDVEGIFCAAYLNKPIVTSLHTTYKLAQPYKPEWTENFHYRINHVDKVIAAENWLLSNSPYILANSKEIVTEINHHYNVMLIDHSNRLTIIPHGIGSLHEFQSSENITEKHHNAQQRIKVLFVGRIEARKGLDQLLLALFHIERLLDHIEVVIVGKFPDTEDAYTRQVTGLVEKLRTKWPKTQVTMLGYLSDTELDAHYATADIFVAPSRFESFGLILIEAMRHGVPVVACNIGGMREIITHGVDGYLFDVGNTQQLADQMKSLIENSDLRAQLGSASYKTYQTKFTSKVMGGALEKYFLSIIEGFSND